MKIKTNFSLQEFIFLFDEVNLHLRAAGEPAVVRAAERQSDEWVQREVFFFLLAFIGGSNRCCLSACSSPLPEISGWELGEAIYNLTQQVTVHMLQQQRATIEVHLSVGDPGSPQAIASSLKVE